MKSVSAYYFPWVSSWTTSTTPKVPIFLDLLILVLRNTRGNYEREHQSEAKPWPCPRIISGARKSAMPQIVKVRSSDICFANRKSINCNNKVESSLVQCKMADFLQMILRNLGQFSLLNVSEAYSWPLQDQKMCLRYIFPHFANCVKGDLI